MDWLSPLWETLHISFFVMIVMMLLEFVELYRMRNHKESAWWTMAGSGRAAGWPYFRQLAVSALLGLIPGCVGGFMVVSLYAHRMVSFGAVLAASFTALGDDAFRMLAMAPLSTVRLELILLLGGLFAGWVADRIMGKKLQEGKNCRIEWHEDDHGHRHTVCDKHQGAASRAEGFWPPIKTWSFARMLLVVLLLVYMISLLGGVHAHGHGELAFHGFLPDFEHIVFLVLAGTALVLILFVNEHFLQEHLWNHLLKKHFPAVFFWTLGTLYLIGFLQSAVDLRAWISDDLSHLTLLLLVAVLIGWIPQSGPHFLFIQLYFTGALPFGVFFANALVQDGHTSLLLLAESRRKFVLLKTVKSVLALAVGSMLLFL